jgi:hypothetical protein
VLLFYVAYLATLQGWFIYLNKLILSKL